jgi:hypothetical protein
MMRHPATVDPGPQPEWEEASGLALPQWEIDHVYRAHPCHYPHHLSAWWL